MTQNRTYSVVIPAHNEQDMIVRALASVATQTYNPDNLEAVVVDNASTDETSKVAGDYLSEMGIPYKIVPERELGVSRAKNKGSEFADGEVLVFLDADSRMKSDLIETIDNAFGEFPAGMIRMVPDIDSILAKALLTFVDFGKTHFPRPAGMSYCARDIFFDVGGFNTQYRCGEDVDFLMKVKQNLASKKIPLTNVTKSEIATSMRRQESGPLGVGYITTLTKWGFAYWGFNRNRYEILNGK